MICPFFYLTHIFEVSRFEVLISRFFLASHADVLRLVTRSSPRTSAEQSDHFRSLAVSLCFERTNQESVVIDMSG